MGQRFAGMVDVSPYLSQNDDWSASSRAEMAGRSSNRITNIQAESQMQRTGIAGAANIKAAEYGAQGQSAAASAAASAQTFGAIAGGIGNIATAGIGAYGKANNLGTYASPNTYNVSAPTMDIYQSTFAEGNRLDGNLYGF